VATRWEGSGFRASSYDDAWARLEADGHDPHGEASLVWSYAPRSVLDAGCGTGRVAIELARRGGADVEVVGVDRDPTMLDRAREKTPDLQWVEADLSRVDLRRRFDVVVMAGNVMIFLDPGTEAGVVANMARHASPTGRLVAGFQLRPGGYGLDAYDAAAAGAGLVLEDRWSTWDRQPFAPGGDYAVSIHRAPPRNLGG
jgi:SAM-dependent methyltransferase